MSNKAGMPAPQTGIYWCSVCKTPAKFQEGDTLPACKNLCGRGHWEFVKVLETVK
jgi:hypothetical protein